MPSPLTQTKFIIAVASGKGGVGKSTMAVNLACALGKKGHVVGLLDADIYGPSQHIMMGLKNKEPQIDQDKKIIPYFQHGIKLMSFGFFAKPDQPVIWRGPMLARMLQQFVNDVNWGTLDYLVVDLPPGTGDVQLTLTQILQVTGVVIVTTPQDVALADAIKGINMFQKMNVPILGIIENMSYFICPECRHESHIFSRGGGKNKAQEMGVPLLGEIPLVEKVCTTSDEGIPLVIKDPNSEISKRFLSMADQIHTQAIRLKANQPKTPPSKDFEV